MLMGSFAITLTVRVLFCLIVLAKQIYPHADVWRGVTKSTFRVASTIAITGSAGVEHDFVFSVTITQVGRHPVGVRVSTDLHKVSAYEFSFFHI